MGKMGCCDTTTISTRCGRFVLAALKMINNHLFNVQDVSLSDNVGFTPPANYYYRLLLVIYDVFHYICQDRVYYLFFMYGKSTDNSSHNEFVEQLYISMKSSLVDLAFRYIKDRDCAEDIVQSVFLKLCQEKITVPGSIKAYLIIMTKNAVLNYIRDNNKIVTSNYIEAQRDVVDDYYSLIEKKEKEDELMSAIDLLPARQREIAILRCSGFSNKEISERLSLSLNTVNSQYRTLRFRLKAVLSEVLVAIAVLIFCS